MANKSRNRYLAKLRLEYLESRWLLDGNTFYVDDDGPNDPGPGDPLVSDPLEDGSDLHPFDAIQEAIDSGAVAEGDTIVLRPGTYAGPGNRDINLRGKAITIRSTDPDDRSVVEATVIDARGSDAEWHRAFYIDQGETSTTAIAGLTLTGGYSNHGGSVYLNGTAVTIEYCRFVGNTTRYDGGAIYVNQNPGTSIAVIRYNTFTRNTARDGGALFGNSATVHFTQNTFTENSANDDGGALVLARGAAEFHGNTLISNRANGDGGAIFTYLASIGFDSDQVRENTASRHGGGIWAQDCQATSGGNAQVSMNEAGGHGGGIWLERGTVRIAGAEICDNTAQLEGGGIFTSAVEEVAIENCQISRNEARHGGAAYFVGGTSLEMTESTVDSNVARGAGGVAYSVNVAAARFLGNTFSNNSAVDIGGAFRLLTSGTATFENNTFEKNSSEKNGGAIDASTLDEVVFRENRFVENASRGGSGGAILLWTIGRSELRDNLFDSNRCRYDGGAVWVYRGIVDSRNDTLIDNHAEQHAGAFYAYTCDVDVTNIRVDGNVAVYDVGGMHLGESTAAIRGSTILGNSATGPGGGVDFYHTDGTIENCLIEGNTARNGAGISLRNYSQADIRENRILGNVAENGDGGGVRVDFSAAFFDDNLIADNVTKTGYGGGVDCYYSSPMFRRNVFLNNYAPKSGTQLAAYACSPTLVGNTLYIDDPSISNELAQVNPRFRSMPLVVNTIIWGTGPSIENPNSSHLFYSNTNDGPLFPADGNIGEAPAFVDSKHPLGPDHKFHTADDGFRLKPGSACIDAGHVAFFDADASRCDVGAYGEALPAADLAEIHVDWTNTTGPWDGTTDHPYRRVWEALLAADEEDTIHVGTGYYEENLVFRSDKPELTIVGAAADTTIVNGTRRAQSATVAETWFVNGLEFRGLTMQNGNGGYGGAVRMVASEADLYENTFQDCFAYVGGGVYVEFNSDAMIDGNTFLRNSSHSGGAIRLEGDSTGAILNNTIAENRALYAGVADGGAMWIDGNPVISGNTILQNRADDFGGGIFCNTGATPTIDHNVIARNLSRVGAGIGTWRASNGTLILNNTIADNEADSGGGLYAWDSDMEVVNTIFWGNAADEGREISVVSASNVAIRYSTVRGGKSGVYTEAGSTLAWGPGMVYADPLFAPRWNDYHLKSTAGRWDPYTAGGAGAWVLDEVCSPGIDRGQPDPDTDDPNDQPYWDWKRETDPNGKRINMGAYGGTVEASRSCDCTSDPPVIILTDPAPGSAESRCAGVITVWFDKEMLPDTVESVLNWQVVGSGGDGLFYDEGRGEDNDVYWPVLDIMYEGNGAPAELLVSDLPCGCLPADIYRLTARHGLLSLGLVQLDGEFPEGGTVEDFPSGNGTAGGNFVATFEITNAPPMGIPGHAVVLQDSQDNLLILQGCDADGDVLEFEICWPDPQKVGRIGHGWLDPGTDDRSDTWYYTPDAGYSGTDEFDFRAFDGQDYSECTPFTIDVIPTPCDLEPTRFEITEEGYAGECLCPGTSLTLQWDAINHGPGETVDFPLYDWMDQVCFSLDDVLDGGDRLLTSTGITRTQPLAAGQSYSMEAVVTLPDDLPGDGGYYLILHVDGTDMQLESNEDNNTAVIPFCIKPFVRLESPFCGIFLDVDDPFTIAWEDSAEGIEAFVNVVLDNDTDLDNGHLGFLVEMRPEDPDGEEGDSAVIQMPALDPGTYYAYTWLSDADGNRLSCPSGAVLINLFETAEIILDPLGDIAAGLPDEYEIYSLELGRTGDRVTFRVRTDYDPRLQGGDVYLEIGGEIAAIATRSRILPSGQQVVAGDLYLGVEFSPGEIVPLPYQVESWTEHISGQSGISVIDDIICMDAEFALFGWFMLGPFGGAGGDLGWTMWCGNDAVSGSLPGPPAVTDVYVGSTRWTAEFLHALEGPGVGRFELGYRVPGGAAQAGSLPWANLDQVSIVFSEAVDVVGEDFDIYGHTDFPIEIAEFSYDPATFTATWTLAVPLQMDGMTVNLSDEIRDSDGNRLDGEWRSGETLFRSGDGTPGGGFEFTFNVVPGDANRDGGVGGGDLDIIRGNWGEPVVTETVPWGPTADEDILRSHWGLNLPPDGTLFADFDGDGLIRASDLDVVRANWGGQPPVAGLSVSGGSGSVARVVGPVENPKARAHDAVLAEWDSRNDTARSAALAEAAWAWELQQRNAATRSKDKAPPARTVAYLFAAAVY